MFRQETPRFLICFELEVANGCWEFEGNFFFMLDTGPYFLEMESLPRIVQCGRHSHLGNKASRVT